MLKQLQSIDYTLTKIIYDFFDNKALKGIAHYFGLIPYSTDSELQLLGAYFGYQGTETDDSRPTQKGLYYADTVI